jgi:hypothetical protein
MTDRYGSENTTTTELATDYFDCRDKEVMQALVTAGTFVALAEGTRRRSGRARLRANIFAGHKPRTDQRRDNTRAQRRTASPCNRLCRHADISIDRRRMFVDKRQATLSFAQSLDARNCFNLEDQKRPKLNIFPCRTALVLNPYGIQSTNFSAIEPCRFEVHGR